MQSVINSKNQVILPKKVRDLLNVEARDRIGWSVDPDGRVAFFLVNLVCGKRSVSKKKGLAIF